MIIDFNLSEFSNLFRCKLGMDQGQSNVGRESDCIKNMHDKGGSRHSVIGTVFRYERRE
jgi:hypothetical protein